MPDTLTVYYNGACPICGAEVRHYQRLASASGAPLDWVDISQTPDALGAYGIDHDGARRRLYATESGGELLGGVEAFARLWERLPRYRLLAAAARSRVMRPVAELVYERMLAPTLYRWNVWREARGGVR